MPLEQMLAAGSTVAAPYPEDVFSSHLYTGTGAAQTITTGIDLTGAAAGPLMQGGMIWTKARTSTTQHMLADTVRGITSFLFSNTTAAAATSANSITSVTASGHLLGTDTSTLSVNSSGVTYAAWTFRRAKKFMDIVTYTGNGGQPRSIAHGLGVAPGLMIIKRTSGTATDWIVYHRSLGAGAQLKLNTTGSSGNYGNYMFGSIGGTAPTATEFFVGNVAEVNAFGSTYVAYIFAHDDSSDGIIQCGSVTKDASGNATVNLGWEPGMLLIKSSSTTGNWIMLDDARGWTIDQGAGILLADSTNAEAAGSATIRKTSTGFTFNGSTPLSATHVYMAIRRGPMKPPTSGTQVFQPLVRTGTSVGTSITGMAFPPDTMLSYPRNQNYRQVGVMDRLRGRYLLYTTVNTTTAEASFTDTLTSWNQDGVSFGTDATTGAVNHSSANYLQLFFRRHAHFHDVISWTGDGTTLRVIKHNLGRAPSMIWIRGRTQTAYGWAAYHGSSPFAGTNLVLSHSGAQGNFNFIGDRPNASTITLGIGNLEYHNLSGVPYMGYLFGDVPGVSASGSYSGQASAVQVTVGFTPRFVMVKRADALGNWFFWDSARGILAANEPYGYMNGLNPEVTNTDYIDPVTGGFIINALHAEINAAGGTYYYYAIA